MVHLLKGVRLTFIPSDVDGGMEGKKKKDQEVEPPQCTWQGGRRWTIMTLAPYFRIRSKEASIN